MANDEGGVLLHFDSGVYHGLNVFGVLIRNLIGDGSALGGLTEGVRSTVTDPLDDPAADVMVVVEDLVERDLLTLAAT